MLLHVFYVGGLEKNFYNLGSGMSESNPLQAFNAQQLYRHGSREGVYGKEQVERVKYNTRTCSIKGVRRIIRKRGSLEEKVVGTVKGGGSAPKSAASTPKKSRTKRVKASKPGNLKAAAHTLKNGWLLEPVSDGKLPVYYR